MISRIKYIQACCTAAVLGLASAWAHAEALDAQTHSFFENKVRPVLAEHCYGCHGPDKQKADLRLDHISYILKGGGMGPAIMAGDANASKLIEAIRYENVDFEMPPKGKLPEEAVRTLEEWVNMGAPWPEEAIPEGKKTEKELFNLAERKEQHWAWQPVQATTPPKVKDKTWAETPIDQFILAKLEDAGLSPAEEADRSILIRRVYFDIIGLPPSHEEIQAFVNDTDPKAYEKMVDRLLASPGFGERWARHWLDLVRYAETYGHEGDYAVRHAWRYRDYVIRALNDDVPYDQFVREHVAGDLLENPRINKEEGYNESILATAFWYMHQATHAPVDVLQDDADRIDNQIDVAGKAFLGMTVACARCHEHKFDAISEDDYYAMAGFLQSSRMDIAFLDQNGQIATKRAELVEHLASTQDATQSTAKAINTRDLRVGDYLQATHEVLYGTRQPGDGTEGLLPDILFADFEGDRFDHWITEGNAFSAPAGFHKSQQGGGNLHGKRMANSYANGSDKFRGRMRSPEFIIERPFISFYIGGGNHEGKTCMNLVVNGETVLSKTGRNSNYLFYETWDVKAYRGMRAQLEIVDAHNESWGHITVDQVTFSENVYPWPLGRSIDAVAKEHKLDVNHLNHWLWVTQDAAANQIDHPLHAWHKLAHAGNDERRFSEERDKLVSRITKEAQPDEKETVFATFDEGTYDGWYASGQAFTNAPTAGDVVFAKDGRMQVPQPGAAHSGLIGSRLQGVLRSPLFTLTHNNIHVRAAGQSGKVRLVIQGYQLVEDNGLLFQGTLLNINHGDRYQWFNMTNGLSKFVGYQAYFEFIDEGDGWLAVDEIRFSNDRQPNADSDFLPYLLKPGGKDWCKNRERLAKRYDIAVREAVTALGNGTVGEEHAPLLNWLMQHHLIPLHGDHASVQDLLKTHHELDRKLPRPVRALAITDGTPVDALRYVRGNHRTPAEAIPRRFLEAIAEEMAPDHEGTSGRLSLAEDMASADNPLTARVMVNRIWKHLYGVGIVSSVDNFGVLGQEPSHPELLDYLATTFIDEGWSIKTMVKSMLMTKTYRMSSDLSNAKAEEQDPANVLLHRMNLRRLQGEVIRDSILKVAGTLNEERYGPSVPAYLSPFNGNHRRPKKSGPMDGDRRRSIYQEVRRNFLSEMLLAFDTPTPDTTIGRRTQSNIPQQALILMNDPFVVDQAKLWGEHLTEHGPKQLEDRIQYLFQSALGRDATDTEVGRMKTFMETQIQEYGLDKDTAQNDAKLWADMCHVMFTLKGFIYIS